MLNNKYLIITILLNASALAAHSVVCGPVWMSAWRGRPEMFASVMFKLV